MSADRTPGSERWIVLGLGSNLGPRERWLARARAGLERAGLAPLIASPIHETDPVGGPAGQPRFLNQVVACPLGAGPPPRRLLEICLGLEHACGRKRAGRWGPRTLDIDILVHGPTVLAEPGLVIPHPRMAERAFVLEPLAELLPDLRHPVLGRTARELLADLRRRGGGPAGGGGTIAGAAP